MIVLSKHQQLSKRRFYYHLKGANQEIILYHTNPISREKGHNHILNMLKEASNYYADNKMTAELGGIILNHNRRLRLLGVEDYLIK